MKLSEVEKIKFSGLGGDLSIDGFKSDNNIGKIGDHMINNSMSIFLILNQEFNISSHVGIPVNGVIGYHLFKNHPISIDYSSKKLQFIMIVNCLREKQENSKNFLSA